MQKVSKMTKRAYHFWRRRIKSKNFVVFGADFPDEYVRKVLQKEDLVFQVKKGLYLLKNKGEDPENLIYRLYWQIVEKLLGPYEPWSIEKESAVALYLGEESIPQRLLVRTQRKVKYLIDFPFAIQIQIRPDTTFHEKTRRKIKIDGIELFVDIPERVLMNIKKRKGPNFIAFIQSMKFDRRMLEVLYSAAPKPVVIKELIKIANKCKKTDIAQMLKDILKKYTVYR